MLILNLISRLISVSAFGLLIYDFGFNTSLETSDFLQYFYFSILLLFIVIESVRIFNNILETKWINFLEPLIPFITVVLILYNSFELNIRFTESVRQFQFLYILSMFIIIIPELISFISHLYKQKFSPAILFVGSFKLLIIIGSLLLLLPNATTTHSLSIVDAVFTSTSAVCVTGLIVLDTGKDFTLFGQTIILVLIQLGGLGMLTLTSFFAYFFKGTSSYQENLYLKDFLSSNEMSGLLSFALKIVLFTLIIEVIGAFFIYINIPVSEYPNLFDRVYFAIFHSVSAFCNAGFSTLSNNMYAEMFRFNYNIHLMLTVLFIVGGLGYAVIFNVFKYIKVKVVTLYKKYVLKVLNYQKSINILTLNTKIVLLSSSVLLLIGTISFFFAEYNNTLAEHTTFTGKFITSLFGGASPRTAGFNTVDLSQLTMPTIMITILLMWIGASPASTGGGIKTSTFALAILNLVATVTGKNRIEIGTREIPQVSVNRAFSIMLISLFVLGISIVLISSIDKDIEFLSIAFECFSAYSTVGLSLGITGILSDESKIILVFVMFIGRVGAINILIGLLRQIQSLPYKYPQESVIIN
jgi:potassium uptake TrkH family protein